MDGYVLTSGALAPFPPAYFVVEALEEDDGGVDHQDSYVHYTFREQIELKN